MLQATDAAELSAPLLLTMGSPTTSSSRAQAAQYPRTRSSSSSSSKNGSSSELSWTARFARQELPGWRPIFTPLQVGAALALMFSFCTVAGVLLLLAALHTQRVVVRYDDAGALAGMSLEQREAAVRGAGHDGILLRVPVGPASDSVVVPHGDQSYQQSTRDATAASHSSSREPTDSSRRQLAPQHIGQAAAAAAAAPPSSAMPPPLQPPIYVHYRLGGYHPNVKRFTKSLSRPQLAGRVRASHTGSHKLDSCEPRRWLSGKRPDPSLPYRGLMAPCGLVAWALFNDSFALEATRQCFDDSSSGSSSTDMMIRLDEDAIADLKQYRQMYGLQRVINHNTVPELAGGGQLMRPPGDDPHFVVWMMSGAHVSVEKPYAVIAADNGNSSLESSSVLDGDSSDGGGTGGRLQHDSASASLLSQQAGALRLGAPGCRLTAVVNNRYNVYGYGSRKELLLVSYGRCGLPRGAVERLSCLLRVGGGGGGLFLPFLYLSLAGLWAVSLAVVFSVVLKYRRRPGQPDLLSWNRPD